MTHNPETKITSIEVYKLIEEIASTSGKNDKIELLKTYLQSPLFELVMQASHDPFLTYGVRKKPAVTKNGDGIFNADTFEMLAKLALRELSGNNAINAISQEMERLDEKSAQLLWNVIIKDLKAGFGAESLNKAKKGLIQTFPYMRCSLLSKVDVSGWDWVGGVISQEKADGMFANIDNKEGGEVNISSRQGSQMPIEKLSSIVHEMKIAMASDTQYHSEIVVEENGVVLAREIGNGILNSVLSGGDFAEGQTPICLIWDAIPMSSVKPKGKFTTPYKTRYLGILDNIEKHNCKSIRLIPTRFTHSIEEAYEHYGEMLLAGKEGTVIKNPAMIWKDGTSKDQIKLKLEVDIDLVITAINMGKEDSRIAGRPGAFTCQTSDGLLQVDVTVKNEAMRDDVEFEPESWIGSVIVVRGNEILSPSKSNALHSIFLPRMAETGYRTDKSEADTLEQVQDQFESAKLGK